MSKETDLLRRAAELLRKACPGREDCTCEFRQGAASLLALADQMERAEPVAVEAVATTVRRDGVLTLDWIVEGGIAAIPEGVTLLVSTAPLVGDNGAGEVYTHPAPEVARDAERYRWLRADHPYSSVYKGEPFIGQQLIGNTGRMVGDHADKTIDKAMAAMQEPKP